MSDRERLQAENDELKKQLENQKKTINLLKKRAVQAIAGKLQEGGHEGGREDRGEDQGRLELASRMKSVFLENIGHEIRTSMNGIVGMTSLVLETDLRDDQRSYLEMVNSSVERLLQVVNELLDFSRIESGEIEFEEEDFNLKQALDHDLYILKVSAEKKGLDLFCDIRPDVPSSIRGDADRLLQILTNLVNNGIRYTSEGQVRIVIGNRGYDPDGKLILRFEVHDTGCGIDGDKLELIRHYFNKKVTRHLELPLSVGTTGLGLTVASQLVKRMGGKIGVDSSVSGSVFWFELPFREVAEAREYGLGREVMEDVQVNLSFAFRDSKVLLVEDEYISRMLLETILVNFGIEVTCVAGGREAVKEVEKTDYDLVLMDVQMEDLDGLEATRIIRRQEASRDSHVPVVALTALATPGDRERCLAAGMDDYLAKPVQQDKLLDLLTRYLTRRVLIMDSDPESQSTLITTLVENGWMVRIADSRRSVMYEASLSGFDLILMDVSFSEGEAMESVRLIRELESYTGKHSIILGISDTERNLAEHGFDGLICRPVVGAKFTEIIKGCVRTG